MALRIKGQTKISSQTLVNFPPIPAFNADFTQGYDTGINPMPSSITFSRADASAIATHVGPDGLIRKVAHNIATYSEDFTNAAWTKYHSTYSTGTGTNPSGTSSPFKLIPSNTYTDGELFQNVNASVGVTYTYSIYLRGGFGLDDWDVELIARTAGNAYITHASVTINLNTGNYTTGSGTFTNTAYSVVNVGGGWYRVSVTGTTPASTSILKLSVLQMSGTGDGTKGVLMWGAQLETNISPSYYVPTTSAAVYSTPRFDYDPVTLEPKGLLIEQSSSNILPYSNVFDNAAWASVNVTPSPNQTTSPDGTNNAYKITETTATGMHYFAPATALTVTGGSVYCGSVYLKSSTGTGYAFFQMAADNSNPGVRYTVVVNLANGSVVTTAATTGGGTPTGTGYKITYAGNGWYRIAVTITAVAGQGIATIIGLSDTSTSFNSFIVPNYVGNTNNSIFAFGAQLEQLTFPTSYIPTTTATVTRAADVASVTNLALMGGFSAAGGTLFAETQLQTVNQIAYITQFNSTSYFNSMSFVKSNSTGSGSGAYLNSYAHDGTATVVNMASTANDGASHRLAMAWSETNIAGSADGASVVTGTARSPVPTKFNIGQRDGTNYWINGTIKRIQYWTSRFADDKLQLISKG